MSDCRILVGDVRATLPTLDTRSVRCVVTSPPYWGLRDYGCAGQLGLERTPEEYVVNLVAVFREARRVLADDGTLWLNLGDSYSGDGRGGNPGDSPHIKQASNEGSLGVRGVRRSPRKDKDLVGIPWMVAFALQADGWYLRSDIIWAKPNGMPESVTDRPSVSHEHVFLLSKSGTYYYDNEAMRTPPAPSTETRLAQDVEAQAGSDRGNGGRKGKPMKAVGRKALPETQARLGALRDKQRGHSRRHQGFNERWDEMERSEQVAGGARLRSVWWIAPAQYRGAHFAVMPERLARLCILGGSAPGDTVLDPFAGSGTVGAVAIGHGRRAVLCELNPAYADLAVQRVGPMYAVLAGSPRG